MQTAVCSVQNVTLSAFKCHHNSLCAQLMDQRTQKNRLSMLSGSYRVRVDTSTSGLLDVVCSSSSYKRTLVALSKADLDLVSVTFLPVYFLSFV